jgi:hypothetical protein
MLAEARKQCTRLFEGMRHRKTQRQLLHLAWRLARQQLEQRQGSTIDIRADGGWLTKQQFGRGKGCCDW